MFWQRVCDLMSRLSPCMLRINQEPRFFTELFYELKSHSSFSNTCIETTVPIPKSLKINAFRDNFHHKLNDMPEFSTDAKPLNSINNLIRQKFYKEASNQHHNQQKRIHHHEYSEINNNQVISPLNLSRLSGTSQNFFNFCENQNKTITNINELKNDKRLKPFAYCI